MSDARRTETSRHAPVSKGPLHDEELVAALLDGEASGPGRLSVDELFAELDRD